jgi:hypothetical protein
VPGHAEALCAHESHLAGQAAVLRNLLRDVVQLRARLVVERGHALRELVRHAHVRLRAVARAQVHRGAMQLGERAARQRLCQRCPHATEHREAAPLRVHHGDGNLVARQLNTAAQARKPVSAAQRANPHAAAEAHLRRAADAACATA